MQYSIRSTRSANGVQAIWYCRWCKTCTLEHKFSTLGFSYVSLQCPLGLIEHKLLWLTNSGLTQSTVHIVSLLAKLNATKMSKWHSYLRLAEWDEWIWLETSHFMHMSRYQTPKRTLEEWTEESKANKHKLSSGHRLATSASTIRHDKQRDRTKISFEIDTPARSWSNLHVRQAYVCWDTCMYPNVSSYHDKVTLGDLLL